MIWSNKISTIELVLLGIFALAYLYYLVKVSFLSRKLNMNMGATSLKFIMRTIYFGLLIAAVLGPSFGITEMEARTAGKDIYLCVDVSQSMNTTDVSPSRIEKVKTELIKLVDGIKDNRIGIIVFSEKAYIQIPLTFDIDVIKGAISKLNTDLLERNGTNLSSALKLASEKLSEQGNAKERNKVAVIVSDGEDFGDIDPTVLQLKNKELSLIFVGVGTEFGGEVQDNVGTYIKDETGNNVISKLNFSNLSKIAFSLRSKPYELNDAKSPIVAINTQIEEMPSLNQSERTVVVANNKYLYFLLPALLLVIIDAIFVVKIFKL
jgi:Ca-activated chloride channel homolog